MSNPVPLSRRLLRAIGRRKLHLGADLAPLAGDLAAELDEPARRIENGIDNLRRRAGVCGPNSRQECTRRAQARKAGMTVSEYITWRERAQRVIGGVIANHRPCPEEEMRAHVSAAYPFGFRKMWPYRAWLRAVREAMDAEYRPARPVVSAAQAALPTLFEETL